MEFNGICLAKTPGCKQNWMWTWTL